MTHSTELREHLEGGIRELEVDIDKLRAAIDALDANSSSPAAPPQRRRRRPTASATTASATQSATQQSTASATTQSTAAAEPAAPAAPAAPEYAVVPAGKLASLLSSSDGVTTAELARRTNGRPDQVLALLKELEQAGRAHRSGRRRSTQWHAGPAADEPEAAPSTAPSTESASGS